MSTTYSGPMEGVQEKMESGRERVASGLDDSARKLREKAEGLPGGDRTTNMAYRAADKLQSAADYLHNHDSQAMVEDMRNLVRRYPTQSLLAAVAVGFIVARSMRDE